MAPRLPEMSGGATYVRNFTEALLARGVEVEQVTVKPANAALDWPAVAVHTLNPHDRLHAGPGWAGSGSAWQRLRRLPVLVMRPFDRWLNRRRFRRVFRRYGSETLVVFTHVLAKIAVDELGWPAPWRSRVIAVGQHHSQFEAIDLESWLRPAIVEHYADLNALTALSEEDARQFRQILPIPCFGIGNPLRPGRPLQECRVSREPILVTLTRYSGEKQLDILVRCFAQATQHPQLSHWRLDLYGEGPEEQALRELVVTLGATDRISVKGRSNDVAEVLAAASLHGLTSLLEGFPMSILEAAEAGVPTVAFDVSPGVREVVGEGGWLVETQNEAAYTSALVEAMSHPEQIAERGQRARDHVQRWSPEAVVDQWAEALVSLSASIKGTHPMANTSHRVGGAGKHRRLSGDAQSHQQ